MFELTALSNDQYLVMGMDNWGVSGQQIVDGTQWNELSHTSAADAAKAYLDTAIAEFFKPISEALEAAKSAVSVNTDDLAFIVVKEPSKGTRATLGEVINLSKDSQIIRAIKEGRTDRLRWVNDTLVILAP